MLKSTFKYWFIVMAGYCVFALWFALQIVWEPRCSSSCTKPYPPHVALEVFFLLLLPLLIGFMAGRSVNKDLPDPTSSNSECLAVLKAEMLSGENSSNFTALSEFSQLLQSAANALREAWKVARKNNMEKTAKEIADTVLDVESAALLTAETLKSQSNAS